MILSSGESRFRALRDGRALLIAGASMGWLMPMAFHVFIVYCRHSRDYYLMMASAPYFHCRRVARAAAIELSIAAQHRQSILSPRLILARRLASHDRPRPRHDNTLTLFLHTHTSILRVDFGRYRAPRLTTAISPVTGDSHCPGRRPPAPPESVCRGHAPALANGLGCRRRFTGHVKARAPLSQGILSPVAIIVEGISAARLLALMRSVRCPPDFGKDSLHDSFISRYLATLCRVPRRD